MIFFSEFNEHYKLFKIHDYNPPYKEKAIFIDPGVYELKNGPEYSKIDEMYELIEAGLPDNTWISIDYPCDMNLDYTDLFIEKTYKHNIRFADEPQYICTPQTEMANIDSFYKEFERTRHIWERDYKIVGLGNICRLFGKGVNEVYRPYTNKVLSYVVDNMKGKWVHVYGAPRWLIKEWKIPLSTHGIKFSVDSTKWTRCSKRWLMEKYGGQKMCTKENRREFYETYVSDL